MERNDTLPIFPDLQFDEILQETSFHERFNTSDFEEILTSSPENQKLASPVAEKFTPFKDIESDLGDSSPVSNIKIENAIESTLFAPKKAIKVGNEIYIVEDPNWTSNDASDHIIVLNPSDSSTNSCDLDMSTSVPSLSLQPWEGNYNFVTKVETSTHSNSKWAYSTVLNKLFMKPFDAVPVAVQVSSWINGYINITPVFTESQYTSETVKRCLNHKLQDKEKNISFYEHIVQVDNSDAEYVTNQGRYSVNIPLGTPAPGESSKLIYVKCGCWNTCTGGPDRRPFCLVFTLFNSGGQEIGRQILDVKVCACPIRDCGYSEKGYLDSGNSKKSTNKRTTKKNTTGKSQKKIKVEPHDQTTELISVPSEIAAEVKRYINMLMAEKFAKERKANLPFPNI